MKKCPGIKPVLIRHYRASIPHNEEVTSPFPFLDGRIKIGWQWISDYEHW
jgi:hypothetical protein